MVPAQARWALLLAVLAAAPAVACVGDCDGDGSVAIDDLLASVRSALGDQPVSACAAADANADGRIDIGELVQAVAAALAGCAATPAPTATPRPNIVIINLDDTRFDGVDRMPAMLQRLAAEGVSFRNSFVSNSVCCPSRASLLSGRYAIHHGTRTVGGDIGGADTFRVSGADQHTAAVWLHEAGYVTGLFGKYLNEYSTGEASAGPGGTFYVPPGWDRWRAFASPEHYGGVTGGTYRIVDEGGQVQTFDVHDSDVQYSTDVLGGWLRDFIRDAAAGDRPFLALFTPYASHADLHLPGPAFRHANLFASLPAWRPPNWYEADISDKPFWLSLVPRDPFGIGLTDATRRAAYQTLMAVDEQLDATLDLLAELSLDERTMVLLTSDNGSMWGEHAIAGQRKENPYEEAIRVPMVVRYPRLRGRLASSRIEPVLNIDVAPTIAELAGVAPAETVDGRSFLPLLADAPPEEPRAPFLIEHFREFRADQLELRAQPQDGDRVRVLYGETRARPRASVTFEFDVGDGSSSGTVAVAIGATVDDTMHALAVAIAATIPAAEMVSVVVDGGALLLTDTTPTHAGAIFFVVRDQGAVMRPGDAIPDYVGVRDVANGYTYVEYETEEVELYDLNADPWQLENRADDPAYAGVRATLAARLREILSETP